MQKAHANREAPSPLEHSQHRAEALLPNWPAQKPRVKKQDNSALPLGRSRPDPAKKRQGSRIHRTVADPLVPNEEKAGRGDPE